MARLVTTCSTKGAGLSRLGRARAVHASRRHAARVALARGARAAAGCGAPALRARAGRWARSASSLGTCGGPGCRAPLKTAAATRAGSRPRGARADARWRRRPGRGRTRSRRVSSSRLRLGRASDTCPGRDADGGAVSRTRGRSAQANVACARAAARGSKAGGASVHVMLEGGPTYAAATSPDSSGQTGSRQAVQALLVILGVGACAPRARTRA